MMQSRYLLTLLFVFLIGTVSAAKVDGMPPGVDIYSAAEVGNGQTCLVGAKLDEDGMNEMPIAFLRAPNPNRNLLWSKSLEIPSATYQGRATHCAASPNALFVLVQSDTQPQQTLTQTLLQLFKLDKKNGRVISEKDVIVPGVSAAYTAWVDEGASNLSVKGDRVVITGKYDLLSNRSAPAGKTAETFSVDVSEDLTSTNDDAKPSEK